jgi:hypothetical protein
VGKPDFGIIMCCKEEVVQESVVHYRNNNSLFPCATFVNAVDYAGWCIIDCVEVALVLHRHLLLLVTKDISRKPEHCYTAIRNMI